MGRPKRTHTKKWHRLVKTLRKKRRVKSPEAVATAKLGKKSYTKNIWKK